MLTRFDEFLIHQTPEPIAHPESMDRNIYDRYWLGGFSESADLYFALSFGLYPNRQVMDCGFSVIRNGTQHCFFGSRRAPTERDETCVGPLALNVIEPMRVLQVVLTGNDSGLTCDLRFEALSGCVEEDRQVLRQGRFTMMDVTRFTQFGRWRGTLQIAGEAIDLSSLKVHGIRDRSWGRRNVGEPEAGVPPNPPQVFFLWAPILWQDHGSLAVFFEDRHGFPLHAEGKTVPLYKTPEQVPGINDPGTRVMTGVSRSIRYASGTRRAASAQLGLLDIDGGLREITLEPLLRHQMKGTGYNHPRWKHGTWQGELVTGHEQWPLDQIDPLALPNLHIQQLVRAHCNGQTGYGVLEQLCIGPHRPSGFAGLNDGAG